MVMVVAQSCGCVSHPSAKTIDRRTPAERRSLLRIDRRSAGGVNESLSALLVR